MEKVKWADLEDDVPLMSSDGPKKQRWADMDDHDDQIVLPRKTLVGTSNGIKTFQEFLHRNGNAYRITSKYKTRKIVKKSNAHTRARDGWAPFGSWVTNDEESKPTEEEPVSIEISKDRQMKAMGQEEKFWEESVILCEQFLQEANKTKRAYDINALRQRREIEEKAAALQEEANRPLGEATGPRYVPPSMRASAGALGQDKRQGQENTLRVANLSEDAREGDLQILFGRVGYVERVFMPKHKEGEKEGQHKGFAFVQFRNNSDAANAITKLNGYGYDSLILSVSWAAPR